MKSGALSGSFSGSLNFGGESGKKVKAMCRHAVKKQRNSMITAVAGNDYEELRTYCKESVSKKCKKARFPKELEAQIKALESRKKGTIIDGDAGSEEEEIELMDDDDDKAEL